MLVDSGRIEEKDKAIRLDLDRESLSNRTFVRLIAKERKFSNVDFRYSHFDACYLRNCVFDSCNFTGCRFVSSNFHGSSFVGCKFDYATFERTIIDNDLLDSSCPGPDNLKMRFARTLRMNFQQLGDAKSANKAITVELEASRQYLRKAWQSNESYYRKKYFGLKRIRAFFEWVQFQILDFVWGNGESVWKLIRFTCIVLAGIAVRDVVRYRDVSLVNSYVGAIADAPQQFLGLSQSSATAGPYASVVMLTRLVVIGFFLSIIIKRFNRR